MQNQNAIVVLGESVIMESIEASLRKEMGMHVTRLCASRADLSEQLNSIQPGLIIFDIYTPDPSSILEVLSEKSDSLFLGIDINCSQVLVFNSYKISLNSLKEFCAVVSDRLEDKETAI